MELPICATHVMGLLENAGFEAYVVGGYVRDALLGRTRDDVDITTSALPSEVHEVLEPAGIAVYDTGIMHGTVTAVIGEFAMREEIEVTTFRVDGPYPDCRHPESVTFTRSLTEDLARRDFTMNAMAYSPNSGLVDPYGGQTDLDAHIIRCVGDADKRFAEDALRIMRALRFAAQLGFEIEPDTSDALRCNSYRLSMIARERIGAEFTKLLCGPHACEVLDEYVDVIGMVIPEILPMVGFEQHNPHHPFDVWGHTLIVVDGIAPKPVLRYAALLHDIGKPPSYFIGSDGIGHFYGHPAVSAEIARNVCHELRLPKDNATRICTLVADHDIGIRPEDKNVRRWMNRLGPDMLHDLLALKRADVGGLREEDHACLHIFDEAEQIMQRLQDEDACFQMKDLAVNGSDLIAIGFEQGPAVGKTLSWLLDQVLDEEVANDCDSLLELARTRL